MASKRDQANRRNASKSTGPRTDAGKRRSRLNAVTHGLTSVATILPGESRNQLVAFEKSLASQYEAVPVAGALCMQYASVFWRLARVRKLETVSLVVSDAGRLTGGTPSQSTQAGGDVITMGRPSDEQQRALRRLSYDLQGLIERMGNLSRYEAMLFSQLVRLTDMLEPYRLKTSAQPDPSQGRLPPGSIGSAE